MSRLNSSIASIALVMLAACDRQVDTGFQGDSLLRIRASVAIPLGLEGADLVPAIAFDSFASPMSGQQACLRSDHKRFVEVGVTGDFPSNFTLDVFDPPPPEAMRQTVDGPAYARGAVTALPRRHPEGLATEPLDNEMFQDWRARDLDTCYIEIGEGNYMPKTDPICIALHACTLDGERCLHRELSCAASQQYVNFNDCELVDSTGDATLGVAGYSVNYSVVYFDGPVEASTSLADMFAGGDAIAAGYHVYRVHLDVDEDPPECLFSAFMEAAERYNAEHDTSLDWQHFVTATPWNGAPLTLEEHKGFFCEYWQVLEDSDCMPVRQTFEEIGLDSISIELGALASTSSM